MQLAKQPNSRLACPTVARGTRAKAGGHDRDRTCDPYHVKVVLSRRRQRRLSENRGIPTAYAVYDFLPSYAMPAVLRSRCDQGVTDLRVPASLLHAGAAKPSRCRQTIGRNGTHQQRFLLNTPRQGGWGCHCGAQGGSKISHRNSRISCPSLRRMIRGRISQVAVPRG